MLSTVSHDDPVSRPCLTAGRARASIPGLTPSPPASPLPASRPMPSPMPPLPSGIAAPRLPLLSAGSGSACCLIGISRLGDGLDGAVARINGRTDLGGYLDIVLDFVFYGAIPLGFVINDPPANGLAGAALLFAFYANGASFLAYAVMAEKRKLDHRGARARNRCSSPPAWPRRRETIAVFFAFCLFPAWFAPIAWGLRRADALHRAVAHRAGPANLRLRLLSASRAPAPRRYRRSGRRRPRARPKAAACRRPMPSSARASSRQVLVRRRRRMGDQALGVAEIVGDLDRSPARSGRRRPTSCRPSGRSRSASSRRVICFVTMSACG